MHRQQLCAICLVRDEDDIIAQTLTHAAQYCDRIFVLDNGSTDETWRIVRDLARQSSAVVPFEQTLQPFWNGLRSIVYNAVHEQLSEDDWWLILDSDEFLAEDPRPVLEIARREGADIIKTWHIQFYFTEKDLETWQQGNDRRDLPIFERRRYYRINWQESRFFRNHPKLAWDARLNEFVPPYLRRTCRRPIFVRHYQFRDPVQIEKRLHLRYRLHVDHGHFPHVVSSDWRSELAASRTLSYHTEGNPWRFTASGLSFYYRHAALSKYRGAVRRLRRLLMRESEVGVSAESRE